MKPFFRSELTDVTEQKCLCLKKGGNFVDQGSKWCSECDVPSMAAFCFRSHKPKDQKTNEPNLVSGFREKIVPCQWSHSGGGPLKDHRGTTKTSLRTTGGPLRTCDENLTENHDRALFGIRLRFVPIVAGLLMVSTSIVHVLEGFNSTAWIFSSSLGRLLTGCRVYVIAWIK